MSSYRQRIKEDEGRRIYRPGSRPSKCSCKFAGFDTETTDNNQRFVVGALTFGDERIQSDNPQVLKDRLKKKDVRGYWICAHNLGFDFHALFKNDELADWNMIYSKGGSLMCAYSYYHNGKFNRKPTEHNDGHKITFIDTMNYARMSLKDIGKIINEQKHEWDFQTDMIKSPEDYKRFLEYNMQDAEIARKFMIYLAQSFFDLGSNIKMTIASTSEKIFRNVYLDRVYEQQPIDQMDFIFKSYYGGRVEVFRRGRIRSHRNYYDFNSLYPSIMQQYDFPDPNTARDIKEGNLEILNDYLGVLECDIYIPPMYRGILPWKSKEKKTLYPVDSEIHGVWTHIELRKAISLGARIIKFGRCIYYVKTCRPFSRFVEDMYALRKKYKKEKSPMEFAVKIVLNSLYGKLAMRYDSRDNYIHKSQIDIKDLNDDFEEIGDFFVVKKPSKPAIYCFPIWSTYVTAYGRIKLYDAIEEQDSDMCDTDSSITSKKITDGSELGMMKLEHTFNDAVLIRPKMYAINLSHEKNGDYNHDMKVTASEVKCKGMSKIVDDETNKMKHTSYAEFLKLCGNGRNLSAKLRKFVKFKEYLRRHLSINSVIDFDKSFSLEDDKRYWKQTFDIEDWQDSEPWRVRFGELWHPSMGDPELILHNRMVAENREKQLADYLSSDHFDRNAYDTSDKPLSESAQDIMDEWRHHE